MSAAPKSVKCWCGDQIEDPTEDEARTFMQFHEVVCAAPAGEQGE